MAERLWLTSPRMRFVQGSPFKANTKDAQGQPLVVKNGPNKGQPAQNWFLAGALAKNNPATMPYLMQIAGHAAAEWPAYFPNGAQPTPPLFGCTHPRFSMKIIDGDGVDENGKQNSAKAGFAGHWVVRFSTYLQAPGVWQEPNFEDLEQITDPRLLPLGYYIRVHHDVQGNGNDQRPGMFIGPNKVAICADQSGAAVIQQGPTTAEAFGAAPTSAAPTTPAGAATPLVSTPPAAATGTASPPPYTGFMTPPPPAHVMLPAANGATYEQMIAAGWTDALLVQHGMMAG